MAVSTTTAAALIQTKIASLLIDPLFGQASTFLSLGARVFQTAAPLTVPTISGNFSPGYVAEAGLIPVADGPSFSGVTLLPSTMQSLKQITVITNEALRQSSQSLDAILQSRLVADMADKVDTQAWSSTGDGVTTPQGLLGWAGTQQLTSADTTLNPDDLIDLQAAALISNIPPGNLRFIMHPATFSALRKLRAFDDGRYLIEPDLTKGPGFTILGTPITLTSKLAENKTVLLDPASVAIAVDVNPAVTVLTERYAEYDEVGIRVVLRLDHKPVQPHSIIVLTTAE